MKKILLLLAFHSFYASAADPKNQILQTSSCECIEPYKQDLLPAFCSLLENISSNNLNKKNKQSGMTPLHFAIQSKRTDAVPLMLKKKGINLNIKDKDGNTPLLLATQLNDFLLIAMLLGTKKIQIDAQNNKKETALIIAALKQNQPIAQLLINHNANIKKTLTYATKNNLRSMMEFLNQLTNQLTLPKKKSTFAKMRKSQTHGSKKKSPKTKVTFHAKAKRTSGKARKCFTDGIEVTDTSENSPSIEFPSVGSFSSEGFNFHFD